MAHKVIWSPESAEDLEAIVNYIRRDSDTYAAGVAARIVTAVERLADFPRMAPVAPDFKDDSVRELHVGSYRIIYRVRAEAVLIGAIVHAARRLKDALRDREI